MKRKYLVTIIERNYNGCFSGRDFSRDFDTQKEAVEFAKKVDRQYLIINFSPEKYKTYNIDVSDDGDNTIFSRTFEF
jgi:hypothetical protein